MGAKINRLLYKPLFVWLYGPAFIAFKASAYFASFTWLPVLACLFAYYMISFILFFFFKKVANKLYAAIPVAIVWVSLLHVVGIAKSFGYPYAFIPLSFYTWFYIAVAILLFLFCRVSVKIPYTWARVCNPVLNVFLVFSTIIFLINGYQLALKNKLDEKIHFHSQLDTLHASNTDIVWILMDEYGSSTCLSKQFSFRNPLDSILVKKHFVMLPSVRSRYAYTLFSVNSIFNMDDSVTPSSFYEAADLLRHGSLIPTFEKSGYRFINLGFFDMAQHPMIADRSGYPYQYIQQLTSGTLFYMLYNKWKNEIAKCDRYSLDVFKKLNDTLFTKSAVPRFIWAHIPVPHEPFCRNKAGKLQKDSSYGGKDSVFIKRKYIDYLEYGNSLLVSLLEKHPDLSEKIVIISGDHGPRFPFQKNPDYKISPYAAVFIPHNYDTLQLRKLRYISQIPGFLVQRVLN